ncbi:hypothetical protein [Pseudophaeobacter flagellatus]|uniref:hypothetical protein n=1 Tax=Pseudophaeobacter flagellatus TaxID=2899119 RepID=UPI001E5B5EC4|nr:hypothetical protein [Pseudophaeobacter flagellatus]MCD9147790.1 hypothetical protein [Pseudophaeobacter flagellatus]
MSDDHDDSQGDGESPPKKKGVDLAALSEKLKAQGDGGGERGRALKKAMEGVRRQIEPLGHLQEQMKHLQGLSGHEGVAANLAEDAKRDSAIQEQMEKALAPYRGLQDRMKNLGLSAGEDSAIGRVAKQIADQQRTIEAMRPHIPEDIAKPEPARQPNIDQFKIPRNPIFETNERLERIEKRFEQMQGIATDAAQIANGLQGAAAEFLQKFEKAAADNDRTAGRAILIGVFAVIIAIAMPAVQIVYSEYRRTPDNGPEVQSALEDVQAGVAGLRDAQAETSVQLGGIINASNDETVTILREIRDLLSKRSAPVGTVLEEVPQ